MSWWARLGAFVLVMGMVVSPRRAKAATLSVLADAAVGPTTTTQLGRAEVVRCEAERSPINGYDPALFDYNDASDPHVATDAPGSHSYDTDLEHADLHAVGGEGVIYAAAAKCDRRREGRGSFRASLGGEDVHYSRGGSTFEFAGQSIADVGAGLRSGVISPGQIPVGVVNLEGQLVAVNNRSLASLTRAGMQPTKIIDLSSNAGVVQKVLGRLGEMGGVPNQSIRIRGTGPGASAIF